MKITMLITSDYCNMMTRNIFNYVKIFKIILAIIEPHFMINNKRFWVMFKYCFKYILIIEICLPFSCINALLLPKPPYHNRYLGPPSS